MAALAAHGLGEIGAHPDFSRTKVTADQNANGFLKTLGRVRENPCATAVHGAPAFLGGNWGWCPELGILLRNRAGFEG